MNRKVWRQTATIEQRLKEQWQVISNKEARIADLEHQLAESQAREAALLVCLRTVRGWVRPEVDELNGMIAEVVNISANSDDTALRQAIDTWRGPVIDELVSCGIYSAAHDTDPRKAIRDVIAWNAVVVLDPAVSAEARNLVEAAKAEEREACILDVVKLAGCNSPSMVADAIRARGTP